MSRKAVVGISGTVALGLAALLAVMLMFVLFPGSGRSAGQALPGSQPLQRLWSAYSIDESYINNGTQVLYQTPTLPSGSLGTFYITVTGQSDVHDSAVESLGCQVDGNDCSPSEFIEIQKQNFDLHDNSVIARWCYLAPPSFPSHQFTIYQRGEGGTDVYIENVLITIDATKNGNCTEFPPAQSDGEVTAQPQH